MKKFISNISKALLIIGVVFATWSCSDDWLRPRVLSDYAPENVFVDEAGFLTLLGAAEGNIRWHWSGSAPIVAAELRFSDVAAMGQTDQANGFNWDAQLHPTGPLGAGQMRPSSWWYESWHGINTANTIISRIDTWRDATEAQRNAILGAAYFHRAWRYFNLVNQFGDVPWLEEETASPRNNFYSYCRWSILERIREDLTFAYEWLPATSLRGRINRYGAGVLLMKVEKSLLNFDRALEIGREIVAAHPLVTQRNLVPTSMQTPRTTLMHDLHSSTGMASPNNTEGIFFIVSNPEGGLGAQTTQFMRYFLPWWDSSFWNAPGQTVGMQMNPPNWSAYNVPNYNLIYGRGIAQTRSTHFHLFDIWDMDPWTPIADVDANPTGRHVRDIRSPLHRNAQGQRTAWRFPEDLTYNHNTLRTSTNPDVNQWFGHPVVRPANVRNPQLPADWTQYIRAWYHWPHYRLYVPTLAGKEAIATGGPSPFQHNGGHTPLYIYRSAEVFLMMAEAYYWTDKFPQAAAMINVVRNRAGAEPITADDIDIAMILAERARELFTEELRKSELTRIAFTYAKTGRPVSIFGGRVYSLDNFSGPGGADVNYKGEGVNFYFDWMMRANNFQGSGITIANGQTFTMSVHHVLWPIPQSAILDNSMGHLNQNIGYAGAENNIPPRIVPPRTR